MNSLYDKAREAFATKQISWTVDDIRAILIDTASYTVDLAAHEFLSSVAAGARKATSAALGSKSATAGVLDAADVTFSAVAAGSTCAALILYQHTGNDATARLIAYLDGKTRFTVAAAASGGATSVTVDPLAAALASAATAAKISGSGPSTITLSSAAAAGARTLAVAALGSGAAAGDVYEISTSGNGLPLSTNGGDITVQWDNGANRILKL